MPTIAQDEALLKKLETSFKVARTSTQYLLKHWKATIKRRRKGVKGDREADELLRKNCGAAVKRAYELKRLYDEALENAGLPASRRKTRSR
jgi:hypothetical protein